MSPQATIKAGRSMRKSKTPLARLTTAKMVAREWPVCFCIPLYIVSRQQRQRLSNLSFEKVISPRSTGIRLINSGQLPTCMILFSLRLEQVRFYRSIILLYHTSFYRRIRHCRLGGRHRSFSSPYPWAWYTRGLNSERPIFLSQGYLPAKSSQIGTPWPTILYGRQNRAVQRQLLSVPLGYEAVIGHGDGVAQQGVAGIH